METNHLGDTGIDGDNISAVLYEVNCGVIDWIELAPDSDSWQALANAVMKLLFLYNAGNFMTG